MSVSVRNRFLQRTDGRKAAEVGYDGRAGATVVLPISAPVRYGYGYVRQGVAEVDPNPNDTEPDVAHVIPGCATSGASTSTIAIDPFVCTAATVLDVWAKRDVREDAELPEGVPAWVKIARINLDGDGTDVEQQVDVGFRDTFVQVVSGVGGEGEEPPTLSFAVASA